NDDMKTIDWDMEKPLRLANLELDEAEYHFVILEFKPKNVSAPYAVVNQKVHLRLVSPETVDIDNGDGTTFEITKDYVHSAVNYGINIVPEGAGKLGKTNGINSIGYSESWFKIYPNPANQRLTLSISNSYDASYRVTVTDISGKTIFDDERAVFNSGL